MEKLDKALLLKALAELGQLVRKPTMLVIGGSAALLLREELTRVTTDCDVMRATPDMGALQEAIRVVADRFDLAGGWLNGSAQTYAEILPPDFEGRLHTLPIFGLLRVALLSRQDVLVMKLYAARPRDIADMALLVPTAGELQFALTQLPHLARIDIHRAARMQIRLEQMIHAQV